MRGSERYTDDGVIVGGNGARKGVDRSSDVVWRGLDGGKTDNGSKGRGCKVVSMLSAGGGPGEITVITRQFWACWRRLAVVDEETTTSSDVDVVGLQFVGIRTRLG